MPKSYDVVGESIKGHTPLTSRSHALHGDATPRGSASGLLVEAEPQARNEKGVGLDPS